MRSGGAAGNVAGMTVVAAGRADGAYAAGLNPLRGRDDELASLRRHLARLRDGAGTSWLLEGAPGLGKSRLIEHAAAAAREGGFAAAPGPRYAPCQPGWHPCPLAGYWPPVRWRQAATWIAFSPNCCATGPSGRFWGPSMRPLSPK